MPPSSAPTDRPPRRWRARLLAVALACLVCEAVLWTFVRLPHPYAAVETQRLDQQVVDHLQGAPPNRYLPSYHLPASIRIETDGDALPGVSGAGTFTINRFGFRSPRLQSVAKAADTRRVFCLGGSTTECLYLDDRAAWPEVLQQELGVPGLDVVNAGHSGDVSRDHVALLAQRVVAFAPDVVIVLAGINDMFQQLAPDYSPLRDDTRARAGARSIGADNALESFACDLSQVARGAVLAMRHLSTPVLAGARQDPHGGWVARERAKWRALPWRSEPLAVDPAPEFAENLRSLVGLCRAHDAVPVLLTQPALWGSDDPRCEQRFWRRPPDDRRVPHRELWQQLERFNDVTRAVAAATGCVLVDLARELPKAVESFYDDDHVNVAGAQQLGRIVSAALSAAPSVAARLRL
ncbi:MAG: GDSL-type esterase/lipase family protein, partial [Planctomycetota bacterium]